MSDLLIKNWSKADWKELLKWAKIGANNAMIGEFTEVEEIPPHGRLIDADDAICHLFNGEQCLYSWDEIEEAIDATETIIPAEEEMK